MADRSSANSTRLESLDALRGIAALAVCWYHMTHGGKLLGNGFAAHASSFGFLGVEVFFVISGFVIPFSMEKTNYHWRHFGSYIKKRLLRVHPPFLIASILAVLLNVISSFVPGYAGSIGKGYLSEALLSLATDSTYLSGVLGRPWILVVAWTLAIEVQFYLLAGIVFPLVAMCGPWMRVLVFPALAGAAVTAGAACAAAGAGVGAGAALASRCCSCSSQVFRSRASRRSACEL